MKPKDGEEAETDEPSATTILASTPEEVGDLKKSAGPFTREGHHEKTASKLAYSFSGALFVAFLVHIFVVYRLTRTMQPNLALEAIDHVFATWVPVFSGIVSAAVTYYFTQNRKGKGQ